MGWKSVTVGAFVYPNPPLVIVSDWIKPPLATTVATAVPAVGAARVTLGAVK